MAFFAIFANDGMYRKPYVLRWIKDRWGAKVFNKNSHAQRVIESNIVGQVGRVLELSINRVRKRYNDPIVNSQVICKTGTTNDSRTCWFMGSTPELTTGIYIGCDDNSSMGKNVFPIHTAFPIWRDLYKTLKIEKKQFSYDPSLHEVWIDKKTGEMVTGNQKNAIRILI
ncbi:MAG: penicillin-binding transpeptidase domain-containing protein [Actinobacteria bacterium]|nr:penicillin-binding transpeptidase domain-containing protein [Actinomycetota bacterium]